MNDGNPKRVNGLINFEKLRMMGRRVNDLVSMMDVRYEAQPITALQNYLHRPLVETSFAKLKMQSHMIEPPSREKQTS